MAFKRNLYPSGVKTVSVRSRYGGGEIDLREEFDDLIFGSANSIPHGKTMIIRRMRRDTDGKLTSCTCVDPQTREPDTESSCPYCLGEGYYWDETWIIGYSTYVGADGGLANRARWLKPGVVRADTKVFYFKYDTVITYDDKIVEVKLDTEGEPVVPYRRQAIYKPQTIVENRSDRGRLEYLTVFCQEFDAIRPD
jgi:hypothetical protein